MYINGAAQAAQIQAYIALSRLLTRHKLRKAIESRAPAELLSQAGLLDRELERGHLAPSLVPAMRALKKAQKTDEVRKSMRSRDTNSWKTPRDVFDNTRGVWRDDDPRVLMAVVSWQPQNREQDAHE